MGSAWRRATGGLLTLVGLALLRQVREARAVRAGRRPRTHATSRVADTPRGPVARHVGTWTPARPRSGTGRLAAAAWSGPATLVGLLLARLGGRRPLWDARHGLWLAAGITGPPATALRLVGRGAVTVGQVVLSLRTELPPSVLAHEAAHVRQSERLGPLMPLLYAWWSARHGYRRHPLERAARRAARRHTPGAPGG